MIFDWDDANRGHIAIHDITPAEAEQVVLNEPTDLEVQVDEADVERVKQVGETNSGRILIVMSTWRGDAVRIITAWDPSKAIKAMYMKERSRRHGVEL